MAKEDDDVGLVGPAYELSEVYCARQLFDLVDEDEEAPPPEDRVTEFNWGWRLLETVATEETAERYEESDEIPKGLLVEVSLGFRLGPTELENYRTETRVVGRFLCVRGEGEWDHEELPPLHTFVSLHAVSILIPYLRQRVSEISGQGPFDPFYLPVVNVHSLMEFFDFEKAVGWAGLQEHPWLAAAFGVPEEELG